MWQRVSNASNCSINEYDDADNSLAISEKVDVRLSPAKAVNGNKGTINTNLDNEDDTNKHSVLNTKDTLFLLDNVSSLSDGSFQRFLEM